MQKSVTFLLATSGLLFLAACGGGSSLPSDKSGSEIAPMTPPVYETLKSSHAKTSVLGGVAIRSDGRTGAISVVKTSGSITHNTGSTTLSDGTYSFSDPDGFDASGNLTDGSAILKPRVLSNTYEYVSVYDQSYVSDGVVYDSIGLTGIVTKPVDVPTTGTAKYAGTAEAFVATSTQGIDLLDGRSNVTVDFGARTADATMSEFSAINTATGARVTGPIDTVSIRGMGIDGNNLHGGTITTTKGGNVVNLVGENANSSSRGAFFGYDATIAAPDELGGVFLLKGDDGVFSGVFLAD